MKLILNQISILLVLILLISSCSTISLTQRRYNKGIHIELGLNSGKSIVKKKTKVSNLQKNDEISVSENIPEIHVETLSITESELPQTANLALIDEKKQVNSITISEDFTSEYSKMEPVETIRTSGNSVIDKKLIKKELKTIKHKNSSEMLDSDRMLLLTIIAILLPPLAVYLYEGSWTINCTINLILTILFFLPGVIHALLVIYDYI